MTAASQHFGYFLTKQHRRDKGIQPTLDKDGLLEDTMPDDPDEVEIQTDTRRAFVKKLTYVTPVLVTLAVNTAFANGSAPTS